MKPDPSNVPYRRSPSRSLTTLTVAGMLGLLALGPALARAQEAAAGAPADGASAKDIQEMRNEIGLLKQGQEALQEALEEIKALLSQNPPRQAPPRDVVPNVAIDLEGHPMLGSSDARLAVVEFSDYQCPYCARHTRDTYPQLEKSFIDTGKVRYAMLDFPLRNHPFAFKAAEAATCAASKGKFWEMHHLLFQNQQALQPEALPTYAERLGIDRAEFQACLDAGRDESIKADIAQAGKAGVNATPTFLIGWLQAGDQLKPAQVIRGAQPFESFERVLNELLEKGPPAAKDAAADPAR